MSKTSRRRQIGDAIRDVRYAAVHLRTAEQHLEERAAGIQAAAYDRTTTRPTPHDDVDEEHGRATIADPTGNAAITADTCRAAERRLDQATARLARAASELHACVTQAIAIAQPTPAELAELNAKAEPGCEVVGRIARPDGGPNYWEPIVATTDFAGLLPKPYALGAWAHKFVQRNGRLPTEHETTAHCEGRRVMVNA